MAIWNARGTFPPEANFRAEYGFFPWSILGTEKNQANINRYKTIIVAQHNICWVQCSSRTVIEGLNALPCSRVEICPNFATRKVPFFCVMTNVGAILALESQMPNNKTNERQRLG